MRKYLLILILFLVACGGQAEPEAPTAAATAPAAEATAPAENRVKATTAAPDAGTATATAPAQTSTGDYPIAANVFEASLVRSTDHVQGNPDGQVTLIEYGDFQ